MKPSLFIKLLLIQLTFHFQLNGQTWEWVRTKATHDDCPENGVNLGLSGGGDIFLRTTRICASHSYVQSNFLFTYDQNGNLQDSATIINGNWRGAIDEQGFLYLSGNNIVKKYSSSGQPAWTVYMPDRYFTTIGATSKGPVLGGYTTDVYCTDTSTYNMLNGNGNELWNRKSDFTPNCGDNFIKIGKNKKIYSVTQEQVNNVPQHKMIILDSLGALINKFNLPVFTWHYTNFRADVLNDESIIISATKSYLSPFCTTTVVKVNPQGNLLWTDQLISKIGEVDAILHDANDNVYLTGDFMDSIKYQNTKILGYRGLMVLKLNANGNLLWEKHTTCTMYSNINLFDAIIDNMNNIYFTGSISGTNNFDNITSSNGSKADIFLAKLNLNNIPTAIPDSDIQNAGLNIFPNPSSGAFTIEYENLNKDMAIRVLNNLGQLVYARQLNATYYSNTIDLSQQPKGLYILKCETDKGTFTKKIILQ